MFFENLWCNVALFALLLNIGLCNKGIWLYEYFEGLTFIHITMSCFTANRENIIFTKTGKFPPMIIACLKYVLCYVFLCNGCFSQQDVNTMASSCLTTMMNVLTFAAMSEMSLGMTSMVTFNLSRCPWSVLAEVPPTTTCLIRKTHAERQVISVEPQVGCWYKLH